MLPQDPPPSETEAHDALPQKRARRWRGAVGAVFGLLVLLLISVPLALAGWLWMGAPGGVGVLAQVIEGKRVDRYGRIYLQNVRENGNEIQIGRIALADRNGEWVVARDVSAQWNPRALLSRRVEVSTINAANLTLLRIPVLGPRGRPGKGPVNVQLDAIVTPLSIAGDVFPRVGAITHDARAKIIVLRDDTLDIDISTQARAGPIDEMAIKVTRVPAAPFDLNVQAIGEKAGLVAALVGAPDAEQTALVLTASGDNQSGKAKLNLTTGNVISADGNMDWNGEELSGSAYLAPHPQSSLGAALSRFGGRVDGRAQGGPVTNGTRRLALALQSAGLNAEFMGNMDFDGFVARSGSRLTVSRSDLRLLSKGLVSGSANAAFDIEGRVPALIGTAKGQVSVFDLRGLGMSLSRVTAPVEIMASATKIDAKALVKNQRLQSTDARLSALASGATLDVRANGERGTNIWSISKADLVGQGATANMRGRFGPQIREIAGRARLDNVTGFVPLLTGSVLVDVDLKQAGQAPWRGKASLRAPRLQSRDPTINSLINNQLTVDVTPIATRGRDAFDWQVRTGAAQARGVVELGLAVPLRGAWSLNAPLTVSGMAISGVTRAGASGQLAYGPAGLAVASENARIAIGGWTLDRASALVVGGRNDAPLRARIEGIAPLGPASISGQIRLGNNQVALTDVLARHAGLQAKGSGLARAGIFDALFDLTLEPGAVLARGSSTGKLGIAVRGGRVGVAADMGFQQAQFAGAPMLIDRGQVGVRGLLSDLALSFDGAINAGGQVGQLRLSGQADVEGRETSLLLNGGGVIGGQALRLTQPLRAVPLGTQARITSQAQWGAYKLGVDGQVRDNGLDVRFVELEGPAVTGRLVGRVAGAQSDLRGNVRVANLKALNNALTGSAQGALTVSGGGARGWTAQIRGEANGLSVGVADLDNLFGARPRFDLSARAMPGRAITGSWALRGQKLMGEGSVLPNPTGGLPNIKGAWRVDGPVRLGGVEIVGDVAGDVALQSGALELVARSSSLTLAGQAFADVRVTSRIANLMALDAIPIKLTGQGDLGPLSLDTNFVSGDVARLQPFGLSYAGVEARGGLNLGANGATGTLQLSGNPGDFLSGGDASGTLTLLSGARGPEIDGRLTFANAAFASAGIAGLNGNIIARGPFDALAANISTQFSLNGEAASARLSGQVRQSDNATNININGEGAYQNAPWRLSEPVMIALQRGTTKASGKANWRSATLGFDATLQPQRLLLVANLEDTPASLFNRGEQRFDGRLSGTVKLNGQGNDFDGEGELRAVGLRPANADRREAIEGNITANLRNGALVIRGNATNPSGLRASGDARLLATTGLSPFRLQILRTAPIEGRFDLNGPVEAIAKLTLSRSSTATGNVTARGELSGTVAAPSIRGRADVKDASLRDPNIGIRITQANAAINFLGPVGDIETFSASDGRGGQLQLGGRIAFAQGVDWRLSGQMTRFQLIQNPQATIIATGPWSIASAGRQTTLGGNLVLDRAQIGIPNPTNRSDALRVREINRPDRLPPPPTQRGRSDATNASTNTVGVAPPLNLDLKIVSQGDARVLGRGLDAYFDMDVTVRGPVARPQINGRAELTEGRFDLAGRSFNMTRGNVRFAAPLEATRLDFVAEREAADITALAKILGTIGRPAFVLESTPPLPQDEILARLLFGRNVAALTIPQATQLALGLSSLATGVQLNPADRLGQALGLERLTLGTEGGDFSGFTAGVRLVRDVYVEVTTGGEDGTVTLLEWRPRPRVQVQVTTSQNRDSSVSVRLRSKD